ncbi:class I SAM-dependent methyltransferase [Algoriphagus sp. AGSA1]|uniref:class I SAM-dependent methyltransferase n=1 Tax=Algoriphagus sp. AGSA1 TaxID=2907213 RepID=UPI001F1E688E|nr:methyltransferase domain-containing protein [Algoriphagus sp. AGSA1]MCE7055183.1 class I SAM-dependent methyltransferase [Algoriphagus sp. AGSA1]
MLSKRLADIVAALPLRDNIRVLEIGCGPGAMAREISKKIGDGHILAIDRSAKAIEQAVGGSQNELRSGKLSFRHVTIENFQLERGEALFDLAVAVRVGALDGRHPEIEERSLTNIANSLTKNGKLFIDGGKPLQEVSLKKYR